MLHVLARPVGLHVRHEPQHPRQRVRDADLGGAHQRHVAEAELAADLRRRDEYDSSRADSPLRPAEDAVIVDSTDLDREGVVDRVVELALTTVVAGR